MNDFNAARKTPLLFAGLHEGIFQSAMDAIVVVDEAQRIVQFNPAAEAVFGYPAAEVLGKPLDVLLPDQYRDVHREHIRQFGETGFTLRSMRQLVLKGKRANGEVFPLEISISRTEFEGKPYFAAIVRDVGERERLEGLLLRQYESLHTLHAITMGLLNRRTLDDLLQFIVDEAMKLLDISYCEILLPQNGGLAAQAFTREKPFQRGNRFTRDEARLSWQVFESGKPAVVVDYSAWADRQGIYEGEGFHAAAVLPLLVNGECTGVLGVTRIVPGYSFAEEDILIATHLADIAALAIENSRLYLEVKRLATTDELTGVPNRRSLMQTGEREVTRAKRYARPFSVMMVDIDHFKTVNDTWGHAAGDLVLRAAAREIQNQIRSLDAMGRYGGREIDSPNIIGRFGGEEFGLLLPETSREGARVVAERIRLALEAMPFPVPCADENGHESHDDIRITVSIGVAGLDSSADGLPDLFARADQALYQAKETGRNRVCAASINKLAKV